MTLSEVSELEIDFDVEELLIELKVSSLIGITNFYCITKYYACVDGGVVTAFHLPKNSFIVHYKSGVTTTYYKGEITTTEKYVHPFVILMRNTATLLKDAVLINASKNGTRCYSIHLDTKGVNVLTLLTTNHPVTCVDTITKLELVPDDKLSLTINSKTINFPDYDHTNILMWIDTVNKLVTNTSKDIL